MRPSAMTFVRTRSLASTTKAATISDAMRLDETRSDTRGEVAVTAFTGRSACLQRNINAHGPAVDPHHMRRGTGSLDHGESRRGPRFRGTVSGSYPLLVIAIPITATAIPKICTGASVSPKRR